MKRKLSMNKSFLKNTMGLFWKVPVMLSIVYLGRYLEKRGFWDSKLPKEFNN